MSGRPVAAESLRCGDRIQLWGAWRQVLGAAPGRDGGADIWVARVGTVHYAAGASVMAAA